MELTETVYMIEIMKKIIEIIEIWCKATRENALSRISSEPLNGYKHISRKYFKLPDIYHAEIIEAIKRIDPFLVEKCTEPIRLKSYRQIEKVLTKSQMELLINPFITIKLQHQFRKIKK